MDLSPNDIIKSIELANKCILSTRAKHCQFKLCTYTLATGEYLYNYRVRDNYYCDKCGSEFGERDNISHSLYYCRQVLPFIENMFTFLTTECKAPSNISFQEYLLGPIGTNLVALNSVFIVIKKYIFYEWAQTTSYNTRLRIIKSRVRRIIMLEKRYYSSKNELDVFFEKWKNFTPIYDMYGPDPLL